MIERILDKFKKIIPVSIFKFFQPGYHWLLSRLAPLVYGFPSRKLIVIGVTGTKGKSTTCNMVWQILTEAGHKTGISTTANVRIADKETINDAQITMRGRFTLQKFIAQMVKADCKYAVIETSSEGILQNRHWGIKYQIAVFTNLAPEHLDHHGSLENYRAAKGIMFQKLQGKSISIINRDDKQADFFLKFPAKQHITFGFSEETNIHASEKQIKDDGSYFLVSGNKMHVPLLGEFNINNALAAIAVARSLNIDWEYIINGLEKFKYMMGRMEEIKTDKIFQIFVDYAHTPESLELVLQTLKPKAERLISVFGSMGGIRDKSKRPRFAKVAAKYADIVIVTNEDECDEDPEKIVNEIWEGLNKFDGEKYKIVDRRQAIRKAISLAREGDIIAVTGKGSEQTMRTNKGKIPWDDRGVVREELKSIH